MTTSGTASIEYDVNEILEEAWERATEGLDLRVGYQLKTARRSLNLLLMDLANKGINLFTVQEGTIPLLTGTDTYNLPADTVDLIEYVLRTTDTTQRDFSLSRVSVSTYAGLSNKQTQGRPNQIYIDRQIAPTVTLYPVPQNDSYTLVYWRLRRIQDAATGTNTIDMPFRFIPALVSGVAYYLAMKVPGGQARVPLLKAAYNEALQDAMDEDRDKSSWHVTPYVGRR
jgi:hypothetical protein